jgi:hypothetical protein
MDELNCDRLPTSVLRDVLGEQLGADFNKKQFDHIAFRQSRMDFEVLAGAHLGPKKEMAQFLPFILQMLNNPTLTQMSGDMGFTWNVPAIVKAFADAAGWKYTQDFYIPMTDAQKQQHQANSPAAIQAQRAKQEQAAAVQKFQQQQTLQQEEQLGRAGAEAIRQTTEAALNPVEVSGEGGNVGFGATEGL